MRLLLTAFILMISIVSVVAESGPEQLFTDANQLYTQAAYDSAAQQYERLIDMGISAPELYYNLANAYYKTGSTAEAILNYERALKLSPGDEDVEYNLRLAKLQVVSRIDEVPQLFFVKWWNQMLSMFSSNQWASFAIMKIWAAFLMGVIMLFVTNNFVKRLSMVLMIMAFFTGLSFAGVAALKYQQENQRDLAVLMSTNTYVKAAPAEDSKDIFILYEGVSMTVLEEVADWSRIKLADGKEGWIASESIEFI